MSHTAATPAQVVFGLKIPPGSLSVGRTKSKKRNGKPGVLALRYPDSDWEIVKCLGDVLGLTVDSLVRMAIHSITSELREKLFPDVKDFWLLPNLAPEIRAELRSQVDAFYRAGCGQRPQSN